MSAPSTTSTTNINQSTTNKEESTNHMNENTTSGFSREDRAAQDQAGISVLDALVAAKHGGRLVKLDQLIADRDDEGNQILKPKAQQLEETLMIVAREVEANAQMVENTRKFKARPFDGAIAFQEILKKIFGQSAIGASSWGRPPEVKQVQVDAKRIEGRVVNEYAKVTWGVMEFAPLEAKFVLGETLDQHYGYCFEVSFYCAKKWEEHVEALFNQVEEYLLTNSIYKGKVIEGVGAGGNNPTIIDPYAIDRTKSVYTRQVERALENSIFGVIRRSNALRRNGINIGEKILLAGTNGSGKSLACMSALQIAREAGSYEDGEVWTAIKARPEEDINKVVAFAERLAPCLVIVEDIEKVMDPSNSGSPAKMEQLLDLFDGAGSKGREVLLAMTSNHDYELSKSMLRPGRIDRIIKVGAMDHESLERLVKTIVGEDRVKDVDFETVGNLFVDCTPVWITQAISRAERSVIIRTGEPKADFATDDFIYEAEDLIDQLNQHRKATDRPEKPEISRAFSDLVKEEVRTEVRTSLTPLMNRFDLEFTEA